MNSVITFEEIVFTAIDATQETFLTHLGVEVLAGRLGSSFAPPRSEITSVVGIANGRVGYLMLGIDRQSAGVLADLLIDEDDAEPRLPGDALGEVTEMIAGAFRDRHHRHLGYVNVGPSLVIPGPVQTVGGIPSVPDADHLAALELTGVTVPFRSSRDDLRFELTICC